jgi:hypothetical protein
MRTTLENAIQKSTTRPSLSVHHTSFLWALLQELVRSTTHRFVACREGGRFAFLGYRTRQPAALQKLPGGLRVVGAIEMDARPLGQPARSLDGLQGGSQKRRVVAVCRGCYYPERDALGMPWASTIIERLRPPRFPRSTGLLPAFSPPHGAFVTQQSTATSARSARSRPMARS